MLYDSLSNDNSLEYRLKKIKEKYEDKAGESILDNLIRRIENMSIIGGSEPEVILMNYEQFKEWFQWCSENDWDFTNIAGIEVVLDRDSIAPVAFIAEKNEAFLNKLKEK